MNSSLPNSPSPKLERLREIDGLLVLFGFFFFLNEIEREKYNDVNVTVAITLRGFEIFKVLRVDLRREREKDSNGKEKRTRVANVIGINFNIEPHWYNVKRIVETVERGKFAVIITHRLG